MFSKEDASFTGRFGGSGLSLSVAKNMVEMMDGTITLESEKNVGTVFTVTVPMRCTDPAEEKRERSYESISLEGKRVLIVEDINENAEIVQDLLELEDVKTERAENGQIALDMIGSSKAGYYDAILMDLRMPVMDGLEATRRIRDLDREDTKTVPIIALTANAFESDVQDTMNAGMDAHLAKPTDVEVLYDTLKRYIAKAEK
jgi:CheY-like chemotaxis protein